MTLSSLAMLGALFLGNGQTDALPMHFADPIDAVSVHMTADAAAVRGKIDGAWTPWQELHVENEQDPTLTESNLAMFDAPVTDLEVRGAATTDVHPIRLSDAPVSYKVAATGTTGTPRILKRDEWGANDDLLYRTPPSSGASAPPPSAPAPVDAMPSGEVSQREKDCTSAQFYYPDEFKTVNKVTKGPNGKTLLWAHTYSKKITLMAVHHTAISVTGDNRSGAEKVRALYQYHAVNRGWGDVGYHYLIDKNGQIYEGKSGGAYVVAGHAYCNNVNTLGIALLGNFDVEQPSQTQMKSLQWLLGDLANTYDIDTSKTVTYHGVTQPPIVGHGDLLSTDCPGYYVKKTLDQVRTHVRSGDLTASITFPAPPQGTVTPPKPATGTPEEALEDETGQDRSVGRLQRKIRTAVRQSASVGGRAAQLEALRRKSTPVQTRVYTPPKTVTPRPTTETTTTSSTVVRVRLSKQENGLRSCADAPLATLKMQYRGTVTCITVDGVPALINTVGMEDYLLGLGEEPDTEPYQKQRAFAIAARSYAAYYLAADHRKFPGKPYDASDDPALFQKYSGKAFEAANPMWVKAVTSTTDLVLSKNATVVRAPYFSNDDGRTRSPDEAGWKNFPFAEVFMSKQDPWCDGLKMAGHGVGMSGCGAKGQANEGKTGEAILSYYYPGTTLKKLTELGQ